MKNSGNPNLREKYLDSEKLFKKYIADGETRSISSLTEFAKLNGMKSSTGQEPTDMGVWKAIWRWASTHKDEAWNLVKNETFGSKHKKFKYDYKQWEEEMIYRIIKSAWQHPTNRKYQKFLKDNGWS
jgi:hypothetical protein